MGLRGWLHREATKPAEDTPFSETSPASEHRPAWMVDGLTVAVVEGHDDVEVVGESFYQDNLWGLVGGRRRDRVRQEIHAVLVAEHDNRYDANAISVWVSGRKVGHVSRDDAVRLRPGLLALQAQHGRPVALPGHIVGGGESEGRAGMLGVFLNYDSAEFGTPGRGRPVFTGSIRTGLSNAMATDEADDSYDLGWVATLPADPVRRLPQLRKLLGIETEIISRHYMFAELETLLYRFRDTFSEALTEYDSICRRHDEEMRVIVPALRRKFGVVPLLDTYRQAAIRHHKAKALDQALWWAERGIELYGDSPASPDMVADLRRRADSYRSALARRR